MTQAKIQPFCRKYNLNIVVYNLKQRTISPNSLTEWSVCLYSYNNHICVVRITAQSSFPDAIAELEENFKYESNEITDDILRQGIEYKFPTTSGKICMFAVFAFDLETCSVVNQLDCEAYAAGTNHSNRLSDCFNGDLTEKELEIERKNVHVFDRENNKSVLDMINYVINNYKGKPKIITNKHGKKIISSYKYQFVGHNASGLDNHIVLNSLPKSYPSVKKTSRGLIKLSFGAGSVHVDDREIPKYAKFVCSKCHITGPMKDIQKEHNMQPQLLKGERAHELIRLSNYEEHEKLWKPYLIDDVLGLVYAVSKHGKSLRKITGVSYNKSLTESYFG